MPIPIAHPLLQTCVFAIDAHAKLRVLGRLPCCVCAAESRRSRDDSARRHVARKRGNRHTAREPTGAIRRRHLLGLLGESRSKPHASATWKPTVFLARSHFLWSPAGLARAS